MKKFVVMSGGFHPFHAGHASLYQQAKEAFPDATVLVCATNVQKDRPFPFSLKQKLAQLSGVPPKDFIEVSRQFTTEDPAVASRIGDPNKAVVIYVRSTKDRNEPPTPWRLGPDGKPPVGKKGKPLSDYLREYPGPDAKLDPVTKHAYMAYLPTVEFGPGITSATQIRKAWPTLNDKRKLALVMSLYPAAQKNPKLAQNVVGMFDQVMGGQVSEGAPIVVMPSPARLKKPEQPKQRYMGDIVPPSPPPSTEKRGVKGRPGQRPMPDHSVTEGYQPGDKITWYHSNHFPEIEGTVVGWKDGHLIVTSVDPSPRNTEKTVAKYRVPKNNIMSHTKQGVAEEKSDAIARTASDLTNPPKVMQHRSKRDREREEQLKYRDTAKRDDDEMFISGDPETQQLLRYVQQHYPNASTKQQAFIKFAQRALQHSKDEDEMQDKEIAGIKQDIAQIKQVVNKNQVSESQDYLEEK